MLNKEYNHLLKCCKKIQSATLGLKYTLDKLLSEKGRSFSVSFDGISYEFNPPTTLEELQEFENLKEIFIEKLLSKSYEDMLQVDKDNNACWDNILIFAMGNPIEDYQIEKIKDSEIIEVSDNKEKIEDGVALNEDSLYVQWQDQNRVKFEDSNGK